MSDFAKAPAPDATGKCGELETVAQAHFDEFGEFDDIAWIKGFHPHPECIQLVTRSQAEELLAPERAESDRLRKLFKTQSDVHSKHVKELITQHEREREIYGQAAQDFRERAEKAEANLEFIERVKGVNEKYANALAFLEMGENDDPEEFAECFWNKFIALEADNAAQAARIKELEKDFYDADKSALGEQSE